MSFLIVKGNIKANKVPLQLEQGKARKTMDKL